MRESRCGLWKLSSKLCSSLLIISRDGRFSSSSRCNFASKDNTHRRWWSEEQIEKRSDTDTVQTFFSSFMKFHAIFFLYNSSVSRTSFLVDFLLLKHSALTTNLPLLLVFLVRVSRLMPIFTRIRCRRQCAWDFLSSRESSDSSDT